MPKKIVIQLTVGWPLDKDDEVDTSSKTIDAIVRESVHDWNFEIDSISVEDYEEDENA